MKISYNMLNLALVITGFILILINALNYFLGYFKTHGKGFQVMGIILIFIGLAISKKIKFKK